jgi:hypothetical protein
MADEEQRVTELAQLSELLAAYRSAQRTGGDASGAFDELVADYRRAGAVRRWQALDDEAEELAVGRGIYATHHEHGGTNHDSYLARNGRWRVHRRGNSGYGLQRLFGGRWTVGVEGVVEAEPPFLVIDLGGSDANVRQLERALRIDVRAGLWPPDRLRSQHLGLLARLNRAEAEPEPPARSLYARIDDDGEIDVYCIAAPDVDVPAGTLRLDPALPLASALDGATAGDRITWTAPSGQRSARVLEIGSELSDVADG